MEVKILLKRNDMEPFIADLVNNPNIPKWLRCVIVTVICGIIVFIGVMLLLKAPMTAGRIFGGILAVLFLGVAVYLLTKIAKSNKE